MNTIPPRRIHLIAIGGAAMHNLALALHHNGATVTGSDDEIYDPSRSRLAAAGLLPTAMGWDADRITSDLDTVIVGMHARADNPELLRARELGLPTLSYPEYIYEASRHKKRIVVGGSHGKTSTTAMILHVLRKCGLDADYLVGAQLEGFERMVRLSDAPIMVIEGDEYLASPILREPKFHFYQPHIAVLTGIAWDHINVFPTWDNYVEQFARFLDTLPDGAFLAHYAGDATLSKVVAERGGRLRTRAYDAFAAQVVDGVTRVPSASGSWHSLSVFGAHNLQNLRAAQLVCAELGVTEEAFLQAVADFTGAAKRLERLYEDSTKVAYKDFAHAPSKVKATVAAMKAQYPSRPLVAVLELHTFSSLNRDFLPEYAGALDAADVAVVYFDPHTLAMKQLPELDEAVVKAGFGRTDLRVVTSADALRRMLDAVDFGGVNLLLMSSGAFGGLDVATEVRRWMEAAV